MVDCPGVSRLPLSPGPAGYGEGRADYHDGARCRSTLGRDFAELGLRRQRGGSTDGCSNARGGREEANSPSFGQGSGILGGRIRLQLNSDSGRHLIEERLVRTACGSPNSTSTCLVSCVGFVAS